MKRIILALTLALTCSPVEGGALELMKVRGGSADTHDRTDSVIGREGKHGRDYYQVFRDRTSGRELFRARLGDEEARWWRFGIIDESDVNGDGRLDYAWYGGDDTSSVMIAYLSSRQGMRAIDVHASISKAFAARHPQATPLDLVAGDDSVTSARILATRSGLMLIATVVRERISEGTSRRMNLEVPESAFVEAPR